MIMGLAVRAFKKTKGKGRCDGRRREVEDT